MAKWQYRKYYGPNVFHVNPEGWTEWEPVTEGLDFYTPRTLLLDMTESGKIEFRQIPEDEDMFVEDEPEDQWPDFHDEVLF